jgi:hypothetical protein
MTSDVVSWDDTRDLFERLTTKEGNVTYRLLASVRPDRRGFGWDC